MAKTSIEWADHSINPIRARNLETGAVGHFCEKISPGCANCYSSAWNKRVRPSGKHLIGTGLEFLPANREKVATFLDQSKLQEVLRRKKPTRYFWCDMTDLFGEWVLDAEIDACFAVMALTPQHTHLVLTKRAERMLAYLNSPAALDLFDRIDDAAGDFGACHANLCCDARWPLPNVWLGVSVENQRFADERIQLLLQTPAAIRFISCEPLLGPVDLEQVYIAERHYRKDALRRSDLEPSLVPDARLDWIIVGGESGAGARPCDLAWVRSIVTQCQAAGVPVFVKQLGAVPLVNAGRLRHWEWRSIKRPEDKRFTTHADRVWRVHLRNKKGGDPAEWRADLRVREFPQTCNV